MSQCLPKFVHPLSGVRRLVSCLLLASPALCGQTEAPAWVDFLENRAAGTMAGSRLLDFSYAGYRFSETPVPDVSAWNTINVISHGAVPDDEGFDDDAIRSAIAAAEASPLPTVVWFPPGRYKVGDMANRDQPIEIRGSRIVLKGAGSGPGGTEIYTETHGSGEIGPWRFRFRPAVIASPLLATVTAAVDRGAFQVQVASTGQLSVGQAVELYQNTTANLELNMPGLDYKAIWRIQNNGIRPYEKHLITAISGNTVTFKNPVNLFLAQDPSTTRINRYDTLEEVGVEGILFTSGWLGEPQIYSHHANDLVDYGWRALTMENVRNSWVRDCEFKDWNEALAIENSMAVTVSNIVCSGKQGHASYYSRYSYGVLFENCRDDAEKNALNIFAGQGHGPGMRWSTTGSVFLNCKMNSHQSIDCHGYHPYGNLLDGVYGGCFRGNGGTEESYPNSGPDLTFWNFIHASSYSTKNFNFWDTVNRQTHTYAYPKFIGFQSPGESISFTNAGFDELHGSAVYPKSLFDAQLQLRLFGGYMSASSSAVGRPAKLANDGDPVTRWISAGPGGGAWLMFDAGREIHANEATVDEYGNGISSYVLESWDGAAWRTAASGFGVGAGKSIAFPRTSARKWRFRVVDMKAGQSAEPASVRSFRVLASAAPAESVIRSESDDASIREDGTVVDQTNITTLLGTGGSSPWVDRCTVYVFRLPDLGNVAGPFSSAAFVFNTAPGQGTIKDNDLYGLGRRAAAEVLPADYYGQTGAPDPTDAELLQAGILTSAMPFGIVNTSTPGGVALRAYLNSQYGGGTGIGQYVFLRLNTSQPKNLINRIALTMAEGGTAETGPRIEFTITPPPMSAGELWRLAHFRSAENSGIGAEDMDADHDGEINLLEFATGQNPHSATLQATPVAVRGAVVDFDYVRSKAAMGDGITFIVQWTADPSASTWETDGVSESILLDDGILQQVRAEIPAAAGGKRFIRLKVQSANP